MKDEQCPQHSLVCSHCGPLPATHLVLPPALAQAVTRTQPSHHQLNVLTAGLVDKSAETNSLAARHIASQVGSWFNTSQEAEAHGGRPGIDQGPTLHGNSGLGRAKGTDFGCSSRRPHCCCHFLLQLFPGTPHPCKSLLPDGPGHKAASVGKLSGGELKVSISQPEKSWPWWRPTLMVPYIAIHHFLPPCLPASPSVSS